MQTAYFSNIGDQIHTLLRNAREEVLVTMAWFTNNDLFDSLLSCLNRGVKVELILLDDVINKQPYAPDFNALIEKGGIFRIVSPTNGFLHHKFCIIDQRTVVTGSYNWTYYAETRNIENILITENKDIATKYIAEYRRLAAVTPPAYNYDRLSWDEIEFVEHVDFDELNFEIESIAKIRQLPERKVFKSNTCVEVVEKRFNPKAAHNIGLQIMKDKNPDYMYPIIRRGDALPYSNCELLYSNKDMRDMLECRLFYGDSENASENILLIERYIKDLTNNREDDYLTISVQITLNTNGYLHIEIKCVETGKAIDLTTTNPKLVNYAD